MENISFEKIKKIIISELRKNTIDEVYTCKHPLFMYNDYSKIFKPEVIRLDLIKIISRIQDQLNVAFFRFDQKHIDYYFKKINKYKTRYKEKENEKLHNEREKIRKQLQDHCIRHFRDSEEFLSVTKSLKINIGSKEQNSRLFRIIDDKRVNFETWLENNKSEFLGRSPRNNEIKAYESIIKLLSDNIKIQRQDIFIEAFRDQYYFKVKFEIIKNKLLSVFNEPVPKPKIFFFKGYNEENLPKNGLILDKSKLMRFNADTVAPFYFSMKQALSREEYMYSHGGKLFLNFGNRYFAKILVRKNMKKLDKEIAVIYQEEEELSQLDIKEYFADNLYIIVDDLIFEIYTNKSGILRSGMDTPEN